MHRKLYPERMPLRWKIIEKEAIDESIFRTTKARKRLILELMDRGGIHIGEVLKLRQKDPQDRKRVLSEEKSGKEYEFVFIPQRVCRSTSDQISAISCEAASIMVVKASMDQ